MYQQTHTLQETQQFSLLADLPEESDAQGAQDAASPVLVAETPSAPARTSLNDIFAGHRATVLAIDTLMDGQRALEMKLLGSAVTARPEVEALLSMAKSAINVLVNKAASVFAPATGPLTINPNDVLEALGLEDWVEDYIQRSYDRRGKEVDPGIPVDLDKIWNYLETRYGGDAGHVEANRQLAARLIEFLRINSDNPVNRTSGAVILSRRVYSEKQFNGMYQASYSSRDTLKDGFKALSSFAEHAGLDALAIAINPARSGLADYEFTFSPRDKVNLPGLDIVLYKEKWEFRFSHEVAEKLMLFLGEFGSP